MKSGVDFNSNHSVLLFSEFQFFLSIFFLQSFREPRRQQNVNDEPGYSVWAEPPTPPCGQTGAQWPHSGYLPGSGGAGGND